MKILPIAVAAVLLPLTGCGKPPEASAPAKAVETPQNAETLKAVRAMVRANNRVVRCRARKEGDLAAAEKSLAESRTALAALQEKALKSLPESDAKGRARLRWSWLGTSFDMTDDDGRVRKERTAEVALAHRDLDRAIELDPNDADALILRGRLLLLEGAELHFFRHGIGPAFPKDTASERLSEFQIDDPPAIENRLESPGPASQIPATCDRAIADFSRAIATRTREAEGFYWRGMAFWYKVLYIVEDPYVTRRSGDREDIRRAVASELDQATENVKQARFLMPQEARYQRMWNEISKFFDRFPVTAIPEQRDLFPVKSEAEVFKSASPGVVLITAQREGGSAKGSGSIMSKTGLVLTNRHVVEGARSIAVSLKDGRKFTAERVATHELYDLALIRLVGDVGTLPVLAFYPEPPKVGEGIVVIGHPTGMTWSLTAGKVSQFRNSEREPGRSVYLQTDAAVNPGNSGGPMLNLRGFIVGVVTMKFADTEGQAFGITKDVAAPFVRRYQ